MRDLKRVIPMIVLGLLLLMSTTRIALLLGEPALAPWGMWAGLATLGAAFSHLLRRVFFPYLDLKTVADLACRSPEGAGRVFLGACIVLAALIVGMSTARAEIPPLAVKHLPVLVDEHRAYWPAGADIPTLAAQVEQETCLSLAHSRCWSPRAELRTSRERGVGLGQITKTERFDSLAEMRAYAPAALRGWSWESATLYDPAYQLRALVLMDRRNYERILTTASEADRLAMMLVAYNGGPGRVINDRRLCGGTAGCDPARWFGHVEHTSMLPKVSTHAGYRSFFSINREYPRNILLVRRARYVEAV